MNSNARRTSRPTRIAPRVLLAVVLSVGGFGLALGSVQAATPAAPSASTGGASGVSYSAATLNGFVNPRGQVTNYVFQYGTTRAYGLQTPLSPAGSGTSAVHVTQTVSGLQPLKTYHYRILATSPGGAVVGHDRTFTTPKIPLSVAIVGIPNPVVYGNTLFVEGTLSGTGAANHVVQLEVNPFPYLGGFKAVGNAELTSSTGGFSFPLPGLLQNAQIRVVTVGKPVVSSPVAVENVAVRVSLHARATRRHGFARLYGTVSPAEVGALVGFQRLKPGHRSINVGGTSVKRGTSSVSRFSRVVRVRRGLYKALIKVSDGAHVSGYSAPVLIR
ncbi:MAG TPA: hypothetical protein VFY36_11910 [Solirubrobacteraceae bacterium]|nr:hypothetical protein [Solirubrobacteraceae bacterium]